MGTVILVVVTVLLASMALIEPNVKFIPVWIFSAAIYGALANALH